MFAGVAVFVVWAWPSIIGLGVAAVLVAALVWEFLEPDERRAVVAHELAHEGQSRQAEFRADELAYGVVGDAMPMALDKLRFKASVEFGLQRAVRTGDRPLLSAGRRRFEELTADQIAAIRGAEAHMAHSVDSTHPPTTARIEALRPDQTVPLRGGLQLSGWRRVESEMSAVRDHMEAALEREVLECAQG